MDILTLNLMGEASVSREERYTPLVNYLNVMAPDVVMLQEGIGGLLHGTRSSIRDINQRLPVPYYLTTATMTHWCVYPFCHYDLGVLSKTPPIKVLTNNLGTKRGASFPVERLVWSSGARALAVLLEWGDRLFWAVSVHLDYTRGEAGFFDQAVALHGMIQLMQRDCQAIVIGGDFNYDLDLSFGHNSVHDMLLGRDFIDLPSPPTHWVPGNPYAEPGATGSRIDYIYTWGAIPAHSDTVFNKPGEFVSDHCGVKAMVAL